mgnify:FL=1
MKKGRTIVVSGTPGTGKTRFGRFLARKLGIEYVNLTIFAKQHHLIRHFDRKRRTAVIDEHRLRREISKYLRTQGTPAVVEGHFSGSLVPARFVKTAFVLRCDPEVLNTRLARRGYSKSKARENVKAEILDVCLSDTVASQGRSKVAEIDTTSRTIENCVREASLILSGRKPRQVGRLDWLALLEQKGRLDKFLKEQGFTWRRK